MKTRIVFIFIALLYGSNSFALKLDSSLITELPVFGMDVVAPDASAPLLADTDGDGIDNSIDNCVSVSNADQVDTDLDDIGNACNADDDGDNSDNRIDALAELS